jgi:hypothetical protein
VVVLPGLLLLLLLLIHWSHPPMINVALLEGIYIKIGAYKAGTESKVPTKVQFILLVILFVSKTVTSFVMLLDEFVPPNWINIPFVRSSAIPGEPR